MQGVEIGEWAGNISRFLLAVIAAMDRVVSAVNNRFRDNRFRGRLRFNGRHKKNSG